VPEKELAVHVDLAPNSKGGWSGTINIPAQNLKNFPLSDVSVSGKSVTFSMQGIPGSPAFKGNLSADGKTISGDFTQGGGALPFKLTRTGEANVQAPPQSTSITKKFEGT
jgi:hypothetical protein